MDIRKMLLAVALLSALCATAATAEESETAPEATPATEATEAPAAEATEEQAKELPPVVKGAVRASLAVEMCCAEGCPVHVRETLSELKGVKFYDVDFPTQTVTVDYVEKQIKLQAIKDAILDLGYPVDGIEPEVPHLDEEEG